MEQQLNLCGTKLSLSSLAIIADILERSGSITVTNGVVDSETPVVKQLGYRIVHGDKPGEYLTSAEKLPWVSRKLYKRSGR